MFGWIARLFGRKTEKKALRDQVRQDAERQVLKDLLPQVVEAILEGRGDERRLNSVKRDLVQAYRVLHLLTGGLEAEFFSRIAGSNGLEYLWLGPNGNAIVISYRLRGETVTSQYTVGFLVT